MAKKDVEARRRKNRRVVNQARAEELAALQSVTSLEHNSVAVAEQEKRSLTVKTVLLQWRDRALNRIKHPIGRRAGWRVNPWVRFSLCAIAPLVILYCCQLITLQEPQAVLDWFSACSGAAWLTYAVLLGVLVLLFSVTTSLLCSTILVASPVLIFAFINHIKEILNGVPVLISDLAQADSPGELASFVKPGLGFESGTTTALWLALLLIVVVAVFACRQKKNFAKWYIRTGGAVLGVALAAICLFSSPAQALLDGPGDEIQAERNDRLGLLAGFYSGWLDSAVEQPNAYNENNMNTILQAARQAAASAPSAAPAEGETVKPNVIMLMSESFCDPEIILPNVDFKDDPIPNYHRLLKDFPGGAFLSNTYAGGTGNVEMEVMTGMPIAFLGSAEDLTALRDRTAYNRIPSIVKTFAGEGYATEFIHSYNNKLYNRSENLPAIGFDKVLFEEDFPEDAERAGVYISDMALTEKLIYEYERRDKDEPMFLFGLSMENHQPYFGTRYAEPSGLRYTCDKLDENGMETLDNLLQGLHDADAALGALVDYFEKRSDEPTIIVFWGDHLPGLNTGYGGDTLYSLLGYVEDDNTKDWDSATMKKMHTTRYLVWNNYGAELEAPEEMSTLGMGTNLLDWAGLEKPLYYHWVDYALQDMLLYRQRLFVPAQGEPLPTPPSGDALARDYRNLVYDMVYGRGYITAEMTRSPKKE